MDDALRRPPPPSPLAGLRASDLVMKKTKECNYETDTNQGPRILINFDRKGRYRSRPCGGGRHPGVIHNTGFGTRLLELQERVVKPIYHSARVVAAVYANNCSLAIYGIQLGFPLRHTAAGKNPTLCACVHFTERSAECFRCERVQV